MKKLITFIIVLGCFLLTQLTASTYLPTMPNLANYFQQSNQWIMLTLSIELSGYAIGQLLWGTLSDYLGRKRMVVFSLILYIIFSFFIAKSQHFFIFCLFYCLLGFAAAAYTSVGNAIIRDIFHDPVKVTQAIACVSIVMISGPVIGPFIGAHLATSFHWPAVFLFLSALALLLLIGVLLFVPETKKTIAPSESLIKTYQLLITHRVYMSYLLILGIMFGTLFSFLNMLPFIYHHVLHLSTRGIGQLMAISSIGMIIGSVLVLIWIKRLGTKKIALAGLLLSLLGAITSTIFSAIHIHHLVLVILPFVLSGIGFGAVIPASKAGAMTALNSHAGAAASMMKFTQVILAIIVLLISSHWHQGLSFYPLSITIATMSSLCLLIFYLGFVKKH